MMVQADTLVAETTTVVSLPEIYLRVKQVIDDPNTGLIDIATIVSRDPGLTARLLKIANSVFFGVRSKVENPMLAVNLLGPQLVHDLVLATSVTRAFSGVCDSVMNMDIFWQNSIYSATLCKLLAEECNVLNTERFFISGLLSDIGHLVMYQQAADSCQAALAIATQQMKPLHAVETQVVGCNYAEVGGKLLKSWGLPDSLCQPVLYQASPEKAEGYIQDAAIVHIASNIIYSIGPDVPLASRDINVEPDIWQLANISEIQCREVLKVADKSANEVLSMLFMGLSEVA
jgi:HD-like signal output (HDOD) protein